MKNDTAGCLVTKPGTNIFLKFGSPRPSPLPARGIAQADQRNATPEA